MFELSKEDLTEGSIPRALLLLAAPLVVQNVTQVVQLAVDLFWLGRLGSEAIASVGLVYPLVSLMVVVATLTPFVGTQVLVSQYVGGDNPEKARRVTFHGVTVGLLAGLVTATAMVVFADPLVRLLGADADITGLAATYLATYALILPFTGVSDSIEAGFVGWGDSRAALYITIVTVGVNVVLDPILILGWGTIPGMGVQGAALATVLGYACGMTTAILFALWLRSSLTLSAADVAFEADIYRELVDVGGPLTVQRVFGTDAARVVMIAIVAAVGGTAGIAAYTIGSRIASVAFIPAGGLQQAAQSVIGQNLGANKPCRASRTTWVGVAIAGVGLGVIGLVQWFVPGAIISIFAPDVGGVAAQYTVLYLEVLAVGYWALGASYLFLAGFNGASQTKTSMVITLVQYWGIRVPFAAVGVFLLGMDVAAAFWAVTVSNVLAAVGAGVYYYYSTSGGMLERAAEQVSAPAAD